MKTLTRISILLLLICFISGAAQRLSFENINSGNALAIITQLQSNPEQKNAEVITQQYGNHNFAEIYTNNKTDLSAIQIGDYNYLNFNNSFEKDRVNSVISAQGNNNIIDVTGSNSISEKLQIRVKGDNMSIFMRNY